MSGQPPLAIDQTSQGLKEEPDGRGQPWKSETVIVKEKKNQRIEIIKLGTVLRISTVMSVKESRTYLEKLYKVQAPKSTKADTGLCRL